MAPKVLPSRVGIIILCSEIWVNVSDSVEMMLHNTEAVWKARQVRPDSLGMFILWKKPESFSHVRSSTTLTLPHWERERASVPADR